MKKLYLFLAVIFSCANQLWAQADFTFDIDSNGVCATRTVNFTSTFATGTHLWDFGDGVVGSQLNPVHIYPASGSFTVIHYTDNSGTLDTFAQTIQVFAPSLTVTSTTPISCFGSNDGSATVSMTYGTAPYVYSWNSSPPQTTATANNLAPGTYYVTGTDANGCTAATVVAITQAPQIFAVTQVVHPTCGASNGSITLVSTGGIAPYTYQWSNGMTTQNANNMPPGIYCITLTDANGCIFATCDTLNATQSNLTITAVVVSPTCNNNDGLINIMVNGGTPTSFLWSNGSTTEDISNLPAGAYMISVTDTFGCTVDTSFSLQNPGAPVVISTVTPTSCVNLSDGAIDITVTGGTGAYTYTWTGGITTQDITGLAAGFYIVTVSDGAGCMGIHTAVVPVGGVQLTFEVDTASCGNGDGGAIVNPGAGTGPFTYNWSNGATSDTLTGLASGYYSVTVSDPTGCERHANVFVPFSRNCYGFITGTVYHDLDGDCVQDAGENGISGAWVDMIPGGAAYTNAQGYYQFRTVPGNYTVTHTSTIHGMVLCPAGGSYSVTIAGGDSSVNNDFADTIPIVSDLRVWLSNSPPPRPGFTVTMYMYVYNDGTTPANGQVSLTLDALVYNSATFNPTPDSVSAATRTVYWNIQNLLPGGIYRFYSITYTVPTIPTIQLGDTLHFTAVADPIAGDFAPANNTHNLYARIIGSWDPNDKAVSYRGNDVDGQPLADITDYLDYHIRFQNTGTDTAFTIVVRDTFDADLDYSTFRLNAASHPCVVSFEQDNIALFTFENILLPDSNVNEPGSHGFVNFSIKTVGTMPLGNVVENQAGIYFDFNPPVMTNRVTTAYMVGIAGVAEQQIQAYPNPSTDKVRIEAGNKPFNNLTLYDMYGREIPVSGSEPVNYADISVKDLSAGIYLIKLNSGKWVSGRIAVIK